VRPITNGHSVWKQNQRAVSIEPCAARDLRPAIALLDDLVLNARCFRREADELRVETIRRVIERGRGFGWVR